jgi:hypothetical protein
MSKKICFLEGARGYGGYGFWTDMAYSIVEIKTGTAEPDFMSLSRSEADHPPILLV